MSEIPPKDLEKAKRIAQLREEEAALEERRKANGLPPLELESETEIPAKKPLNLAVNLKPGSKDTRATKILRGAKTLTRKGIREVKSTASVGRELLREELLPTVDDAAQLKELRKRGVEKAKKIGRQTKEKIKGTTEKVRKSGRKVKEKIKKTTKDPSFSAHLRDGLGARPEDDPVARAKEEKKAEVGLNNLGFIISEKRDTFFAKAFQKAKGLFKEKGVAYKFFKQLGDGFSEDAKLAKQKAANITKGKEVKNALTLVGHAIKYGRIVTDLTGVSLVSPLRYFMMIGASFARVSKTAKEVRLSNEAVKEKTRIRDAEKAAEEAWKVYTLAEKKSGDTPPDADQLKEAYLKTIPESLQARLQDTGTALGFWQEIFTKDLASSVEKIQTKIEKIKANDSLSAEQKEAEELKILNKYKQKLEDLDRILTQYGTVDALANAGRYAEFAGKAAVAILTIETLVLSVEKLFENLANNQAEMYPTEPTNSSMDITDSQRDVIRGLENKTPEVENTQVGELKLKDMLGVDQDTTTPPPTTDTLKISPDSSVVTPADTTQVAGVEPAVPPTPEPGTPPVNPDAVIKQGEGIEHALRRQIENNPELAKSLGFQEGGDIREFSGRMAHQQAIENGYVDPATGQEIRVGGKGGEVAYQFKMEGGKVVGIVERDVKTGDILDAHKTDAPFEQDTEKYEYKYNKQAVSTETAPAETSTPTPTETTPSVDEARARVLEQLGEQTPRVISPTPEQTELELKDLIEVTNEPTTAKVNPEEILQQKASEGATAKASFRETPGEVTPYNAPPDYMADAPGSRATYEPYNGGRRVWGAGNPSRELLEGVQREINNLHQANLEQIFPNDTQEVWAMVSRGSAKQMLELNESNIQESSKPFFRYLKKLQEVSGLDPKGKVLFFRGTENVGDYVKRALREIAEKRPERMMEVVQSTLR